MVFGVLVVVSFLTVVAYALVFFAVAAWRVFSGSGRDPMAEKFDDVLTDILASSGPGLRLPSAEARPGECR